MAELHQKRGLTVSRLRLDCTLMALTLSQLAAFLASSQHSNPSGRTTIWTRIQQQLCHLAVAPAVLFFAVLMQEIGAFGAESEIGLLGKKGRIFGGPPVIGRPRLQRPAPVARLIQLLPSNHAGGG